MILNVRHYHQAGSKDKDITLNQAAHTKRN